MNMNINKIRFIGRHIIRNNKPYFSYSGCGFIFGIKPTSSPYSFTLSLDSELREHDAQYIAIYVNDEFHSKEKLIEGTNTIKVSLNNISDKALVRVIKLNETYLSSIYLSDIVLENATLGDILPSRRKLVGFYGDSLTCGFGLLEYKGAGFKMETEDFTKSYANLACSALNMDYSVVARSGISVILKIWCDKTFKEIYDTVDMLDKGILDRKLDYAVINLGTNDSGAYSLLKENKESALLEFKEEYINLLERIIRDNPGVKLILCHSMVYIFDEFINAIKESKEYINNHYDNPCEIIAFAPNGDGADGHPYWPAHEENSKLLVNAIKKLQ